MPFVTKRQMRLKKNLSLTRIHASKIKEFEASRQAFIDINKRIKNCKDPYSLDILNKKKQDINKILQYEEEYFLDVGLIVFEYNEIENEVGHNERKRELSNLYFKKIGIEVACDLRIDTTCPNCHCPMEEESGYTVCNSCGKTRNDIHFSKDLSYKELQEYEHKPKFGYDKMSHLEDWLNRFQAKENRTIPTEVLDMVKMELKKERCTDFKNISEHRIKWYLKNLKLNDYYDNVINIRNRISGRPPFVLTPEINHKIKQMFSQIQVPFEKFKPCNRKNFLSYSYFLNKFFYILKLDEFAEYFPLLKSADKLRQQDEIFKKIIEYMKETDSSVDWEFYPSF